MRLLTLGYWLLKLTLTRIGEMMVALGTYYALTPTAQTAVVKTVATIAALRATSVQTTGAVLVEGYYAQNDGGGGQFYGVDGAAPGTYIEDGGLTILPTGGDGSAAWIRIVDGPINIKWFGANGEWGNHPLSSVFATLADAQAVYPFVNSLAQEVSWAAIQAAILTAQNLSSTGGGPDYSLALRPNLYIPSGVYNTNSPLWISGTPSARGFGIEGEVKSIYEMGAVIRYSGADYAIRTAYGLQSNSSLTVGTGSKSLVVNFLSTTNYISAGSTVTLVNMSDASATMTGTITTYSGSILTVNVASSAGSGTYRGWFIRAPGDIYNNYWQTFGVNVTQSCNGMLYFEGCQESIFDGLQLHGFEPVTTPLAFTVLSGVYANDCALSRFQDCSVNQVQIGYNFKSGGVQETVIDGAGVYGVVTCFDIGEAYNLVITNTFNEAFENGVLLENTATSVAQVLCFGLEVLNNSWSLAEGSVNARAFKIKDTTVSKSMRAKFNYYGNLHQNNVGSNPPFYIEIYPNGSNGFTDIKGNIYNNVFYNCTNGAISCSDDRTQVNVYGNTAQTAYAYGGYLPQIVTLLDTPMLQTGAVVLAKSGGVPDYSTNTTAEQVLFIVPVPPGMLGPNGCVKISATIQTPNNANSKTLRIRLNGLAGSLVAAITQTSSNGVQITATIGNNNDPAQQNSSTIFINKTSPATILPYDAYTTIDTAQLTQIFFTCQLAVGTDLVFVYDYIIEAFPD